MTTSSGVSPRIGIIGTGAIGGFYGMMLAKAGLDVHFLLRSEYAAVKAQGLHVDSAVHGQLHLQPVQAYQSVADMPPCDWLLVGAKTLSNAALAPLINQAAAAGARVVLLQNGLGVEDELRPLLDDSLHLLGGLCIICVHRAAPGMVVHQSQGMVNLGYHSGPAQQPAAQLAIAEEGAALFRQAGLDSSALASLPQARWQKLVWNVPYNGLAVLLNAGTSALMANADSRALIGELMQEVVAAAAACGHPLAEGTAERMLKFTERMPDYLPSMYHDFAGQRPMELPAIYAAPIAAAQAAGCAVPRMQMLLQALGFLQQRNAQRSA
jgi:2-dehydropantoate 2-reductase